MKLFKLAMWRMAAAMVVILTAWAAFFYMAVMEEVNDEVDDSLEDYAETLMIRSLSGEEMPSSSNVRTTNITCMRSLPNMLTGIRTLRITMRWFILRRRRSTNLPEF